MNNFVAISNHSHDDCKSHLTLLSLLYDCCNSEQKGELQLVSAGHTSASVIEAKRMLCKKLLMSLVMTIAVSSQMASAEISARAPMANPRDGAVNATTNNGVTHPGFASRMPLTSDMRSELLTRDVDLRSLAANYVYGPTGSDSMDGWLMILVGGGLIVLQLRRKQKTLPQRPVIESENKLFWG